MADKAATAKTPKAPKSSPGGEKKKFDIGRFFREYRSEFKKVVWPTRKAVINNTVITIFMIVLVSVFICALDLGLSTLIGLILQNS